MNAFIPYVDEVPEGQATDGENGDASWSDDELLEHIAEIINENFVLEVQASRELED
jgi:hypothetical protein